MNIVKLLVNGYLIQGKMLLVYRYLNKRLDLVKKTTKQKRLPEKAAA